MQKASNISVNVMIMSVCVGRLGVYTDIVKKGGCAISFLINYMHFYRSGWPPRGSISMIFIVRIENFPQSPPRKSGIYIDFCRVELGPGLFGATQEG